MGISGRIARYFQDSEITPLLALLGLLLGAFAVLVTPREEEPQINVTFANVFIPFTGASASEVEHLVTTPAEQVLSEIEGVKHIYSVSRPGMAILTVEYEVGQERAGAIVRLYNAVFSNQDWLPAGLGVGQALIKPKGIDDVPVVSITLWAPAPEQGAYELQRVAHTLESELKRVPGTRDIYTIGGPGQTVMVELDLPALSGYGLAPADLRHALQAANRVEHSGAVVGSGGEIPVQTGTYFRNTEEIASLVVGMHKEVPVYLRDVASIRHGSDHPGQLVWMGKGASTNGAGEVFPAVTLAIAKQPGTNAVQVADEIIQRFEQMRGIFVPDAIEATITRNYGATANDKAQTLIKKLTFATASVVLLVLLALGWREALTVGVAVIVTLAITLFASWAWGFTLNRVSLFALIFSIGILVDDAIVVVENIHRHLAMGATSLREAIPAGVDEVGGPTILATFTVIAALLPMAFVSGLMGPYMSPIPINASIGMLISLAVAFVVTPWLAFRLLGGHAGSHEQDEESRLERLARKVVGPLLRGREGRPLRWLLTLLILVLIGGAVSLTLFQAVVLKMLPFDNKSEFQLVLDMPEGTTLEHTNQVLLELGQALGQTEEVTDYQIYAGTAAPINFNGLVRQYYLREGAAVGDIQVNLVDKHARERKSHDIARAVRNELQAIANRHGGNLKIAEVPPGPPVLAPLVAEVYGLNYEGQIQAAKQLRALFEQTQDIVDVDDSVESNAPRFIVQIDRRAAARHGLDQATIVDALGTALGGEDVTYLHSDAGKYPVAIRLRATLADQADVQALLNLHLPTGEGMIALSEVVSIEQTQREHAIYHKDLLPVVFVTADMAGDLDSPLYGMFDLVKRINAHEATDELAQYFIQQPENPYDYSLKWDGEWQITYETFRDMGLAYSVGLVLIYLLVVAQFRSYLVPLIIMAPIPLTVIGVLPGHALLGAQFTATSMIGMIALAGIIVRNSILLVDFINTSVAAGMPFEQAVIRSGAVRAKPIALTGLAAMLGAFFILDDPIFSGLAVSLIFGILVSTLLTLVVIPVMYYAFLRKRYE